MVWPGARPVKALPLLQDEQRRAADPRAQVWLSASAGTGKTQVLVARVLRLLLRPNADPAAILCLTFTKAGAAEMATRLSERLAFWVRLPEAELKKELFALGEDPNDAALRARARALFARVLDARGGGLRIQTIHAFAQSLLAAFPLEAGLAPGFRALEAREEAALARRVLAGLVVAAEREGRQRLIAALQQLSRRLGEEGTERFLRDCARAPDVMARLPAGIEPFVRQALDLPIGDIWPAPAAMPCSTWRAWPRSRRSMPPGARRAALNGRMRSRIGGRSDPPGGRRRSIGCMRSGRPGMAACARSTRDRRRPIPAMRRLPSVCTAIAARFSTCGVARGWPISSPRRSTPAATMLPPMRTPSARRAPSISTI